MKVIKLVIALLVLAVVGLGATSLKQWQWLKAEKMELAKLHQQIENRKFTDIKAAALKKAEAERIAQEKKEWAEELDRDTVGKAEGPWHPIKRQVVSNPEYYGFKGDSNKESVVKEWVNDRTAEFVNKCGYNDPRFGGSIGIKEAGKFAVVVEKDGTGSFSCQEFVRKNVGDPFPDSPVKIIKMPNSVEQAKFLAHEGSDGQFVADHPSYEYFWVPTMAPRKE
jgi:hypothetical protein